MIGRCYNASHDSYKRYGGRGIYVCDKWKNSIADFINWCIREGWEKGLQIDRKDNDGPYCEHNCRIVTPKFNSTNRRDNRKVEIGGEVLILKDWAIKKGINYGTLHKRLTMGWSMEDAIGIPVSTKYRNRNAK